MNNAITVYELLGLIKDGKAPKKIIYDNKKYFIEVHDYSLNGEKVFWLFEDNNIIEIMTKKVEILEEDKPIIEKITLKGEDIRFGIMSEWLDFNPNENEQKICSAIESIGITLNKIIDYINRKEDK